MMIFMLVSIVLLLVIVFQLAEVLHRLPPRNRAKEAMERDLRRAAERNGGQDSDRKG
ncbi:hypothetical protein GXP70_13175 [Paenibacillus lycopersici]|uniref:Uncharacterized protein n=1 Tax=Paenibacillus lycopersici TaxID=2704462 RepID=A0A6C0FUH4_9BACL|nr:hypothetical protein [Paenibacillus lycopersici]QHT60806.1 hypothetical protein GXP70_13175 [Paenibacillus lycopersici]